MKSSLFHTASLPIVALVGRPNVGKSSLFNALVGAKKAVVFDTPNTTRDVVSSVVKNPDFPYFIVDTAGLSFGDREEFEVDIQAQTRIAIEEADLVIFLIDAREGILPKDQEIVNSLRKKSTPFIFVANKAENISDVNEFYSLGLGEPILTSATERRGIADLSLEIVKKLKTLGFKKTVYEPTKKTSLVFVGRPNVGKSSLINAYLNSNRVIVSDTPGTTRDLTEVEFTYEDNEYLLLDTAGVRRRARQSSLIEHFGIMRTLEALHRSDCAFLLMDATEGPTTQDARVGKELVDSGVGVCLVFNKIDQLENFAEARAKLENDARRQFAFLAYAPVIFISALTRKNIFYLFDLARTIKSARKVVIDPVQLEQAFNKFIVRRPPPVKGKKFKFYSITQIAEASTPTFQIICNLPESLNFSYKRYLTNRLREEFDIAGVKIKLEFSEPRE